MYTQYVLVTVSGLLIELQEMKQWLEGEDDIGDTDHFGV